jgi:hypothetical protein
MQRPNAHNVLIFDAPHLAPTVCLGRHRRQHKCCAPAVRCTRRPSTDAKPPPSTAARSAPTSGRKRGSCRCYDIYAHKHVPFMIGRLCVRSAGRVGCTLQLVLTRRTAHGLCGPSGQKIAHGVACTEQDSNLRPEGLVPKTSALDHSAIRARRVVHTCLSLLAICGRCGPLDQSSCASTLVAVVEAAGRGGREDTMPRAAVTTDIVRQDGTGRFEAICVLALAACLRSTE